MIGAVVSHKLGLWNTTSSATVREDVLIFGLGSLSVAVEYHRRSAESLINSLNTVTERHRKVSLALLSHQVDRLGQQAAQILDTAEWSPPNFASAPARQPLGLTAPEHTHEQDAADQRRCTPFCCLTTAHSRSHVLAEAASPHTCHPHQLHHTAPHVTGCQWAARPCRVKPNTNHLIEALASRFTACRKKHRVALNRIAALVNADPDTDFEDAAIVHLHFQQKDVRNKRKWLRNINNPSYL